VIELAVVVDRVAINTGFVVNETSFPYPVPELLVAYARIWYVVPGSNPVRLLVKLDVPVPSVVLKSPMVGFKVIDQQAPFEVMAVPPSELIFPPDTAVVWPIEVAAIVERVVTPVGIVVNETSFPYPVPELLVAYARIWYVVPGSNPVRLLVKLAVPVPSVVLKSPMVGFKVIDQQAPFEVMVVPPSELIFPPDTAVVCPIEAAVTVVREGTTIAFVVKDHIKSLANGILAWFLAPLVIIQVYVLEGKKLLKGVKLTVEPEYATTPVNEVTPSFMVKVDIVIVEGSIGWLNVALTTLLSATLIAPIAGSVEITVGIVLVVKSLSFP